MIRMAKTEKDFYRRYLEIEQVNDLDLLHYIRDGMLNETINDGVICTIHKELIANTVMADDGYMSFMHSMTTNTALPDDIQLRLTLAFRTRLARLEGVKTGNVIAVSFGNDTPIYMKGGR